MSETRNATSDEQLMSRICSEYSEMPGLRLTCKQAQRLFGLNERTCVELLDALVARTFLMRKPDGLYIRRPGESPDLAAIDRGPLVFGLKRTA